MTAGGKHTSRASEAVTCTAPAAVAPSNASAAAVTIVLFIRKPLHAICVRGGDLQGRKRRRLGYAWAAVAIAAPRAVGRSAVHAGLYAELNGSQSACASSWDKGGYEEYIIAV